MKEVRMGLEASEVSSASMQPAATSYCRSAATHRGTGGKGGGDRVMTTDYGYSADTVRIQCGLKSSYGTSYGTASYLSMPSFLFFPKSLFRVALSLLNATREQEERRHKPVKLAI